MIAIAVLANEHHDALRAIYNHYVETSACTFDTRPFSREERKAWYGQFVDPYRCFVAVDAGRVAGYACATRFRTKPAYQTSVEVSIYVSEDHHGTGVASRLYEALLKYLATTDIHRAYAGITLPNDASVALHKKFGFEQTGLFNEVGIKFGQYWDVAWFERPIG